MEKNIQLLDCTLRDGAYIVDSKFGTPAIKGIIKKTQDANIDVIECGWLKDKPHIQGTTYYHVPADLEQYLQNKNPSAIYVAMIDWDRYDLNNLPVCDHNSVDAIRIVFPHGKCKQGAAVAEKVREKGYAVYLQAANTLSYDENDLTELADTVNALKPVAISIVDTFGAMYEDDLERIATSLHAKLDKGIKLGFHSHNNQQLSYSLTIRFINMLKDKRGIIVDSSLCGMGRGAGNAPTELVANYLNTRYHANYDLNPIMDAIDMYMPFFQKNYKWGYSTAYMIAGTYCCHVNNIAYLWNNHHSSNKDLMNVIESMRPDDRMKYDYDLLERKYLENQSRMVDDEIAVEELRRKFKNRKVLLIAPGRSIVEQRYKIDKYYKKHRPIVIMVNALNKEIDGDYLFVTNTARYGYAKNAYNEKFVNINKILLSNVKTEGEEGEFVINYNSVIKRNWQHYDNAVMCCLRLMFKIGVKDVAIAGFDGFKDSYNESYADPSLPRINNGIRWEDLNGEIQEMFSVFKLQIKKEMIVRLITDSIFR